MRFIEAAERVKQKSNGRFEITVFHSGQFGTDIDTFTQVRIGGVQMMVLSNVITATAAPLTSPSACRSPSRPTTRSGRAMDGKLRALLREDLKKAGYLYHQQDPRQRLPPDHQQQGPINDVDDIQGLKLRVPPSPIQVSTWNAIGAAPASMNFSELYTALQTGVVDGQEGPASLAKTTRLYEVQKYMSITSTCGTAGTP